MRVVNRTAVTITGAKPSIDWMRRTDTDFNKGAVTVPRVKAYGSAFLLPEFGLEKIDLQDIHSVVVDVGDDDIEGEEL